MIGDRWHVTPTEAARHYPCDEVIDEPALAAWRGVSIVATPAQVWPWVAQIRLAPYSYDWLDNLGRRSPRELRGMPDPQPGEPFTRVAGRPMGHVISAVPGEHYTGRIAGAVMSYVLADAGSGTRLVLKIVTDLPRVAAPFLSVGDLVMARRQLRNLKKLSEAGTTSA